jgi:hypothetical protein
MKSLIRNRLYRLFLGFLLGLLCRFGLGLWAKLIGNSPGGLPRQCQNCSGKINSAEDRCAARDLCPDEAASRYATDPVDEPLPP